MDFTRSRKDQLLFEIKFYRQAPGTILNFTTMPLLRTKHPRQKERNAIGSLGHGGAGSDQNPATPAAGSAGEGGEDD
jgi:hypothetical protein